MIVVVIIGLLAAMAIPAFQKVRESSRGSAMDNDARQLASAAQQYMLENNLTTVTATLATTPGSRRFPKSSNFRDVNNRFAILRRLVRLEIPVHINLGEANLPQSTLHYIRQLPVDRHFPILLDKDSIA